MATVTTKLIKNFKIFTNIRCFSTEIGVDFKQPPDIQIGSNSDRAKLNFDEEWETALPFEKMPGPSAVNFICSFLPGGKYYGKSIVKVYEMTRKEYGDIYIIPGTFGKRDIVITFDPENFRKVFRSEGVWPIRRGLDSITYYRKVARPDLFRNVGGLVAEQGQEWSHFRTVVNPVMMQPKTIKLYLPSVDKVVQDFIERIRNIRDSTTLEVPHNFEEDINNWTLESVGLVALDTRLGLINDTTNQKAQNLISCLKNFFQLSYDLDVKPSLWKYISTPKFKEFTKNLDTMTETISEYVDEAKTRLEKNNIKKENKYEESVLEKLLKVDERIARIMAMDMLMAGVDTTSSAFVSCLFHLAKSPDKQEILRQEIRKILPEKMTPLNADKMNNLPYLRACIKESLRKMPVTVGNFRTTAKNIVLSGYRIPKDVDILMNSYLIQIDEKYFHKPKEFIPERWLRQTSSSNDQQQCPSARNSDPFVFLPFGFGPRMCIGKRFVELELECALARIIRNFYVEYNYPDIRFKETIINVPDSELKFKFSDVSN